jgi:hypothetical protein
VEARFPSEPNGWALLRVSNDADVELIERLETYAAARWTLVDHRTIAKREDGVHLIVTVDREAVGFVLLTGKSEPNGDIELRRLLVAGNAPSLQDMALRAVMDLSFSDWCSNRLWVACVNCDPPLVTALHALGFALEGPTGGADAGEAFSMLASVYARRCDFYCRRPRLVED